MDSKNYTEVLIDGNIYTLGGEEEEAYLQKVASYINDKIALLRKQKGFGRQSAEYQSVMIYLNLADDYFKERERAQRLGEQQDGIEKETYSLKHELVTTQMKLEGALRELEKAQQLNARLKEEQQTEAGTGPEETLEGGVSGESGESSRAKAVRPDEDSPESGESRAAGPGPANDRTELEHQIEENRQLREELERLRAIQAAKSSLPKSRSRKTAKAARPAPEEAARQTAAAGEQADLKQ